MRDFIIRRAALSDIDDLKSLADANKHELGFVLRPAIIRSIERNEIFVAERSKTIIGFVEYHHRRDMQTTLYHIVVQSDHRRQGIGCALIAELQKESARLGKTVIQLKCPMDLESQGFYSKLGFQRRGEQKGKARRLVLWRLAIS